jgi:hypothetical protein
VTIQSTALFEAILEAAGDLADARNDEVIFGLIDRIERPSGPLWDLIRELKITCRHRYVERQVRRKEEYFRNCRSNHEDNHGGLGDDLRTLGQLWSRQPSRKSDDLDYGSPVARAHLRRYRWELAGLRPCGECRICVRQKFHPVYDTSPSKARRLADRQLSKDLIDTKKQHKVVEDIFTEVLH